MDARKKFMEEHKDNINEPKFEYLRSLQDSFKNYEKRQKAYEANKNNFQVGTYVTFQPSQRAVFHKKFYETRPAIHKIVEIDATRCAY